jgi:hypothetical protein
MRGIEEGLGDVKSRRMLRSDLCVHYYALGFKGDQVNIKDLLVLEFASSQAAK